jgi:hypothetical protein
MRLTNEPGGGARLNQSTKIPLCPGRDQHDARCQLRESLDQRSGQIEATLLPEIDVDEHYVGLLLDNLVYRFRARPCCPHDFEVFSRQARGRNLEEGLVVVHDQTAQGHVLEHRTGL